MTRKNFVTHLECANCGARYEAGQIHNLCTGCQKPLWVRYDLAALGRHFSKKDLIGRPPIMWRYMEMLPIGDASKIISLVENVTPVLETKRLAAEFGVKHLYIKDESRLPTGSFKARGMTMAISMANEFGIKKVAVPTAGNAGGAMAAYAARAGMEAYVFMPEDTPAINMKECYLAGAKTFLVNGLITDCGRIVGEGKAKMGWFDVSTLKEPYRIEGKKTMGLELAEQFDWELPDVILYPTGGGTGLIGMWKAFDELAQLGWLKSSKMPKMISCQSEGCAPIATAFASGERFAKKFENAATVASGIRVPAAVGDFMILDAVRASGGVALATPEKDIPRWMQLASSKEGISLCPETAVCLGALDVLLQRGTIKREDRIVIFNTGAAQKYPEAVQENLPRIDIGQPIEWHSLDNRINLVAEGELQKMATQMKIKVAQFGLGPIGIESLKLAAGKPWIEIVGGVDIAPDKIGKDLADITGDPAVRGKKVYQSINDLVAFAKPDVVLHTSVSKFAAAAAQIDPIVRLGISVVSSCEELLCPAFRDAALAAQLDALCKQHNARVLGTGVNPGFVMDVLPVVMTGVSRTVHAVNVQRVVNATTRRGPLQRKIGSGWTPEEFEGRFNEGKAGHAGLKDSVALIAHCLDWKVDAIQEMGRAMVADHDIRTPHVEVKKGQCCGLHQIGIATVGGKSVITLDIKMYLDAPNPHDAVQIEGEPPLSVVIQGGVAGDHATVAAVVNAIPRVLAANPGLRLMTDIAVPCFA